VAPENSRGFSLSAVDPVQRYQAIDLTTRLVDDAALLRTGRASNVMAPNQASLHKVIAGLFPTSSGNMHMKLSPNWDLGTAVRYTNHDLGYKGLYSIEVDPTLIRGVYDTILANI
jgi:hypothetical protein